MSSAAIYFVIGGVVAATIHPEGADQSTSGRGQEAGCSVGFSHDQNSRPCLIWVNAATRCG